MQLMDRVSKARDDVQNWTKSGVIEHGHYDTCAGDLAESLLRRTWSGTITSDPDFLANALMSCAILRAMEMTESQVTECDEDHCWTTSEFSRRADRFITNLGEIAAGSPLSIVKDSGVSRLGFPIVHAERGAADQRIVAAWAVVKGSVAPFIYERNVRRLAR